jgi:uncharacterized protein YndB with AHSA1/START domain
VRSAFLAQAPIVMAPPVSPALRESWKDVAAMGAGRTIVVERETMIRARPAAVWSVIEDTRQLPMWFAFAEKVEVLEGSGEGMRMRLTRRWRSRKSETDVVVTLYEPPRLIAWRIEDERVDGKTVPRYARESRFFIWLEPHDPDTLVRLRSEQEPSSRAGGLAIKFFGRRDAEFRMVKSLERLQMVASILP